MVTMTASNRDCNLTNDSVDEFAHLVRIVVARFVRRLPPSVQRDDLMAAGMIGLVRALQQSGHIRESSPEMFAAYARIKIRGAILDELRRHDWAPRRRRGGKSAEEREVAPVHVIGFDDLAPDAIGGLLAEVAQDSAAETWGMRSPEAELERKSFIRKLRHCIEALPERERGIVQMRYFEDVPSKEIASLLNVSEARVSQLHARALSAIRGQIAAADDLPLAA